MVSDREKVGRLNNLRGLDLVDGLEGIVTGLFRARGTIEGHTPIKREIDSTSYPSGANYLYRPVSRGGVTLYFGMPSGQKIELRAAYRSQQMKHYDTLVRFLEGITDSDEAEVVARLKKRNEASVLQLLIAKGQYFMRGPEINDYLEKLPDYFIEQYDLA